MADTEPIDVLFCANPGYYQHLAVAAVSLVEHNRGRPLRLHVITCDEDPVRRDMLERTLAAWPGIGLHVYLADGSVIGDFFVDGFISKECYLRLIASEILPQHVRRVVYLDCDLVVMDDISPLWTADLGANLLAAAPDYPRLPEFMSDEHRDGLGIPRDAVYVNSGVLVIDIDRWRAEGMAWTFIDFVRRMGSKLPFFDQDAINAVLAGRITLLDPRWNLQSRMYYTGRKALPDDYAATREARRDPGIIHFTGSEKPWLFRSRTAKKGVYFKHLEKTAWRGQGPACRTSVQALEHHAGAVLARHFDLDYLQLLFKARRILERSGAVVTGSPAGAGLRTGAKGN
ncbi:glycosyltransferase family 8 protein [Acuticoccus sediminis]|uniref:Glycosyltransferase family 8 protein n=1 Tax=Acuticoccus sediminis TaxID=2184697 RepID=A0A8B2NKB4_9HYPH|nr:glycosyltransferase family 8 protein [Acuticoccus sediminis]RAH98334.1 glycosyltransferase family 8 protein [Acuticoccus sediminis]